MKIGSLFSGIGGFDLAAESLGWQTAWFSEIDPYASEVLKQHWPNVPNVGDITKVNGATLEKVDLLCGGFPCQDISLAGRGGGLDGTRSGLWTEYARIIKEVNPAWVVIENVPALRTRGLDRVLQDLSALGYDAEWYCLPAAAVGAPHRRDRIWIVAYANGEWKQQRRGTVEAVGGRPADEGLETTASPDAHEPRLQRRLSRILQECASQRTVGKMGTSVSDASSGRHGTPEEEIRARGNDVVEGGWWAAEPNVGRVANGIPARVDRIRCLGNALVPQVAYCIFKAIEEEINATKDTLET